ncbi:MAG: hypothetical protein WBA76_01425, partial [Phormidesmis sp.]
MVSQTLTSNAPAASSLPELPSDLLAEPTERQVTFQPDAFDQHVMSTYGRFPIALERGEGCR